MAGNSQRRGAVRKGGKGRAVGSGGQGRQALEGRGPTPKAADRTGHPAQRRAEAAKRSPAKRGSGGARPATAAGAGSTGSRYAAGPSRTGARRKAGASEVVAGRNAVVEALRAEVPVTTLYLAHRIDSDDRVREALTTAGQRGIPVLECPRGELDRLTDGAVHQGLAVQVPAYDYADAADLVAPETVAELLALGRRPLIVALDGITDPRNLGAIIRSVAAFGGHGVVVPERRSVGMTASAWKTSAGAAARVPVAQVGNLTRAVESFQSAGFFVVGLDMGGDLDLPALGSVLGSHEPLVLVVGSEGKGLSRLVRQTCDRIAAIPMAGPVESLNAGVATSIALYEASRVRRG